MFSEDKALIISRLQDAYIKVQAIKRADFNDTEDEDLDGDFGFIYFLVNEYYKNCIKNNIEPDNGLLQVLDSYDSYMENRQAAPSSNMPSKYAALNRGHYSRLESEISTGLLRVIGNLENLQNGQRLDDITIDAVIGNRPLDESKYGSLIEYVVLQKDLHLASKIFKCQKIDQSFHAKILEKIKNDTNFATGYKNMTNLPVAEFISHGQSLQLSMQLSPTDHKRSAGIMTGLRQ